MAVWFLLVFIFFYHKQWNTNNTTKQYYTCCWYMLYYIKLLCGRAKVSYMIRAFFLDTFLFTCLWYYLSWKQVFKNTVMLFIRFVVAVETPIVCLNNHTCMYTSYTTQCIFECICMYSYMGIVICDQWLPIFLQNYFYYCIPLYHHQIIYVQSLHD